MRNPIPVLCLLLLPALGFSQMGSNKSGDITSGDRVVAEVEKYGGSAETRPKFRVLNEKKDTLMEINFKKDLSYDWMQFRFPGRTEPVEVNSSEIVTGLNYRKNLGAFLVKNHLITPEGTLSDTAFQSFTARYDENLTEKYFRLNENERKLAATRLDWTPENNNYVHVNGHPAGSATVPDGQGELISGIVFYDLNGQVVARGERGNFGAVALKMRDGKTLNLKIMEGDTRSYDGKRRFIVAVLRELCRNGYYAI